MTPPALSAMPIQRDRDDLTELLNRLGEEGDDADRPSIRAIYSELRGLAGRSLRGVHSGQTVQATALVHEAWLRLAKPTVGPFSDRAHFFRVAARAMRCILVSHHRHRSALKRGGGRRRVELDTVLACFERSADLVELDRALTTLATQDRRASRIVELRFFGGCTNAEIAEALSISESTVQREWRFARAWLRTILDGTQDNDR